MFVRWTHMLKANFLEPRLEGELEPPNSQKKASDQCHLHLLYCVERSTVRKSAGRMHCQR